MGKYYCPGGKVPHPPDRFMIQDGAIFPAGDQKSKLSDPSPIPTTKPDYGTDSKDSYVLCGRRSAPAGKFRLLGVDTFSGPASDFLVGDFNDKREAVAEATKRAQPLTPMYVYNSYGELLFSAGKP
jgi:hypothetical protein